MEILPKIIDKKKKKHHTHGFDMSKRLAPTPVTQ